MIAFDKAQRNIQRVENRQSRSLPISILMGNKLGLHSIELEEILIACFHLAGYYVELFERDHIPCATQELFVCVGGAALNQLSQGKYHHGKYAVCRRLF